MLYRSSYPSLSTAERRLEGVRRTEHHRCSPAHSPPRCRQQHEGAITDFCSHPEIRQFLPSPSSSLTDQRRDPVALHCRASLSNAATELAHHRTSQATTELHSSYVLPLQEPSNLRHPVFRFEVPPSQKTVDLVTGVQPPSPVIALGLGSGKVSFLSPPVFFFFIMYLYPVGRWMTRGKAMATMG